MDTFYDLKREILCNGFIVIDKVFSDEEVGSIVNAISKINAINPAFRRTNDLFAIRQFFRHVPETKGLIFIDQLRSIIYNLFGYDYFVTKSIYFDKPQKSNWFVAYHQDLTISVDKKLEVDGFGPWTVKQNQFAVQPSLDILERNFTLRIHLDDTDENNGALKVIPGSHKRGVYRPETIDWSKEKETVCNVRKGGIMIMKPLLLHASNRTTNSKSRRVVHIEFSNCSLPGKLRWSEKESLQLI